MSWISLGKWEELLNNCTPGAIQTLNLYSMEYDLGFTEPGGQNNYPLLSKAECLNIVRQIWDDEGEVDNYPDVQCALDGLDMALGCREFVYFPWRLMKEPIIIHEVTHALLDKGRGRAKKLGHGLKFVTKYFQLLLKYNIVEQDKLFKAAKKYSVKRTQPNHQGPFV